MLLPQLANRRGFDNILGSYHPGRKPAAIALSLELDAVLVAGGQVLSREDLGRRNLSLQAGWDEAAGNLIALAINREGAIAASLTHSGHGQWWKLSIGETCAGSWLAHPHTFSIVNDFLRTRLGGEPYYRLPAPGERSMLVTADAPTVADTNERDVVIYQAGFPVPLDRARPVEHTGAGFLLAS